jgi:hypothetical protein
MKGMDSGRLAALVTLILMLLIAAGAGYRLQIGPTGLTFERNAAQN